MRRGRKKLLFTAVIVIGLLGFVEVLCRVAWAFSGVPFLAEPVPFHSYFYPELDPVLATEVRDDDAIFDVLLLGGSVVAKELTNIGRQLEEQLGADSKRRTRVFSLAHIGHTSRDSWFKYRRLGRQRFDLVLFYHGINEARANVCPPAMFRDDYSHWGWYALLDAYEGGGPRWLATPYSLRFAAIKLGGKAGILKFVPKHRPRKEWLDYGLDIKTARSFRANVASIAAAAKARGEPVALLSFATWIAPGWSEAKFRNRELGYAVPGLAVELWGTPASVEKAVVAHNAVLKDIADQSEHVHWIDTATGMPRGGRWFNDVCHLTYEGSARFVGLVVAALRSEGLLE